MRYVWLSPDNKKQYITTNAADPNVPAGYIKTNTSDGSGQIVDGATDQQVQVFVGGLASGGYPTYWGYAGTDPGKANPNGILNG